MGRAVASSLVQGGPELSASESQALRSTGPEVRLAPPCRVPLFPAAQGRSRGRQPKGLGPIKEEKKKKNVKGSPVSFTQHVINSQQKMPWIHNGSRRRGRKALTSMRFLVGFF